MKKKYVLHDGRIFHLSIDEFLLFSNEFYCVLLCWNDESHDPMIFAMGLSEEILKGIFYLSYSHFDHHEVVNFCDMIDEI